VGFATRRRSRPGRQFATALDCDGCMVAARWRKRKGFATVRLPDGLVCEAEVHWYEATGIGRREVKVKRLVG
jgi:hypothetical protein